MKDLEISFKRNEKCIIIFSGFNQRAIIAFLRTLKSNNINFVIIAKSYLDDIFLTEYKDNVLAVRKSIELNLDDILCSIKKVKEKCNADKYIIAPTTEALNRFLLYHKDEFEEIGCEIPLVDKELYEAISDKYSFGSICSKNGIQVPKEYEFSEKFYFPIVAKPKKYFAYSDNKVLYPIIIKSKEDLSTFYKNNNIEDYYYQKYIYGKSFYLLYYFHRNGTIYKYSQENLIQQPQGKSIIAAISSDFHNTDESLKYENLFKSLTQLSHL